MAKVRAAVTCHGKAVVSVFDLLGHRENDLTAALGFTLARSPGLLDGLLRVFDVPASAGVVLRVEARDEAGRTDLERLGPPLPMNRRIPSGASYRAARVWVLVDQLLTASSPNDAIASSKALTGNAPAETEEG